MDKAIEKILAEYDVRAEKERAFFANPRQMQRNLDELLLRVGPASGQFINLLVKETSAKSILELGTSFGYSTVWLAEAARETGGRVTTIDLVQTKQDYAAEMLKRAGLGGFVKFECGEALDILKALGGPFDFVLIDLWKDLYVPCFEIIYPKLAKGALLVADNILQPVEAKRDAQAYRAAVRAKKGMESVLLPIGSGLEVSRYSPDNWWPV